MRNVAPLNNNKSSKTILSNKLPTKKFDLDNTLAIRPKDQTIKPTDQTIRPKDQTIRPKDQTTKPTDQTILPSNRKKVKFTKSNISVSKCAGTGTLLLEDYYDKKTKETYLTVFAVKDYNGNFSFPGGRVDKGHTEEISAAKELREETLNMFNFSSKIYESADYIELATSGRPYRGYVLYVRGKEIITKNNIMYPIFNRIYYNNKKSIASNNNSDIHWSETTEITRISIKRLATDLGFIKDPDNKTEQNDSGLLNTVDIYSNPIQINPRDTRFIKSIFDSNLIDPYRQQTNLTQHTLNYNSKYKPKEHFEFLNGTTCYWI